MKTISKCECSKTKWRNRSGWCLTNGIIELVVLTGGGHLASLRRLDPESPNLLWEAPWTTIDPQKYVEAQHKKLYGPAPAGPFLSGFTGHAAVLGYFGGPSEAEAAAGLPIHGEAGSRLWRTVSHGASRQAATLVMEVYEPVMGLRLVRELSLRSGESTVRIKERVTNERNADTFYQWVEHATFGEPLLGHDSSSLTIPAIRSCTWPLGYEGKGLLADNQQFRWPHAPIAMGGTADLSRGFIRDGSGFVVATQIDPLRSLGFIAVANSRLHLAAGYCFPRTMFPWVAIWEENRAREYPPWNHVTRALGLEFGTSPLPLGLAEAVHHGPMFDSPTVAHIGAKQTVAVDYCVFATAMPENWRSINDVVLTDAGLEVTGGESREKLNLGGARKMKK
jgi:hypothetical protein